MSVVKNSSAMQNHWIKYQKQFSYAQDIDFSDTCDMVVEIMKELRLTNMLT